MTAPDTKTPLKISQKIGVQTWRVLMNTFSLMTRRRHREMEPWLVKHPYGEHPAERLELIERKPGSPKKAPVVYIHGGGWICGKMEMYTAELDFLAQAGHPVFNLEYPLAPERPHPHMLLSLLSALAWIQENYPEHKSIHLMGDSAGGNLVLMLAILVTNSELIKNLDAEFALKLPDIKSVISLYGVLDRLSWIDDKFPSAALMLESYAGAEALKKEIGSSQAVTPMDLKFNSLPPTFIAVGSKDQLAQSSRICAEHLKKDFKDIKYEVYQGEAHGFFNRSERPASQKLRGEIVDFFSA